MATPTFIQRPRSFEILGFLGSKFVMHIRRQGFPSGSELDVKLYPYTSSGVVSKYPLVDEQQPSILPLSGSSDTDELIIEGIVTDQLTDEKYLAKFFVDGTVHGVATMAFTNDVLADEPAGGDYILIGAGGSETLVLMNPDAQKGKLYEFTADQLATNKQQFNHKLGSLLLRSTAFTQDYDQRLDVKVFPLQGAAGKDPRDWAWLYLPESINPEDTLRFLHIEPLF